MIDLNNNIKGYIKQICFRTHKFINNIYKVIRYKIIMVKHQRNITSDFKLILFVHCRFYDNYL